MVLDARSSSTGVDSPDASGPPGQGTYREILKSTTLIGGATALNVAISLVRTKLMAMILGPAGIGLMGLYGAIHDLTRGVAGMGINNSGVRQIADAVGSGDRARVERTATVLRSVAVMLALLGAASLFLLSDQVSIISFGDASHSTAVAWLGVAVGFTLFADGQLALMQGTRRIANMAKISVLGGLMGAAAAIASVYAWGLAGVAPALVTMSAAQAATAWWYARRLSLGTGAPMKLADMGAEAAALLRLGAAFMASGLLMMGAAYADRTIVLRELGLGAAGLYQAAWVIGGLYVGFILQAMGTDFYPRLVAASSKNSECNRLVNEQAMVSLLLAGPGVLATLTLAPAILALAYTPSFLSAVEVLRWFCLGIALRVISWPMGFIIVAKNSRTLFVATELAWALFNITATWFCVRWFGLAGAGIAFLASYVLHIAMIYPSVRMLTGFRWSKFNFFTGLIYTALAATVFVAFKILPPWQATAFGCFATLGTAAYSFYALVTLVPPQRVPGRLQRALARARKVAPHPGTEGSVQ